MCVETVLEMCVCVETAPKMCVLKITVVHLKKIIIECYQYYFQKKNKEWSDGAEDGSEDEWDSGMAVGSILIEKHV